MVGYGLMIEDLKQRKPIKVILDDLDIGVFKFNESNNRYEGFGCLTLEAIKKILKKEIDFIKIERVITNE